MIIIITIKIEIMVIIIVMIIIVITIIIIIMIAVIILFPSDLLMLYYDMLCCNVSNTCWRSITGISKLYIG